MKIVICGSINFTPKIEETADLLISLGHEVDIPLTSQRIINGELTLDDFINEKEKSGDAVFREVATIKMKEDIIKRYYNKIKESDAIFVVNLEKNGVVNYIGGNTFLEMGFAHVLNKDIYLLNKIPESLFKDELVAMQPVVLEGDVSKIQ